MGRLNRLQPRWHIVFVVIAVLVVFTDQLTKAWIRANIPLHQSILDIGFFRLINTQNTGAAFGIFYGYSFPLMIVAATGAVLVIVFEVLIQSRFQQIDNRLVRIALGLILGGTVGNLIDRIMYGSVTDFLDFIVWPAFNVADSSTTIGVILFIYSLLFLTRDMQKDKTADDQPEQKADKDY